jgi:hypothetical protein
MGHRLYREILKGAPPDWGRPERLVALVIADDANEETRRSWMPIEGCWRRGRWVDGICEKTGMTPVSIRRALHQLGKRGFELRVPISTGRDGRPVYAARGRSTDFYVPSLPPRPAPERRSDLSTFEDGKALSFDPKGAQFSSERRSDLSAPLLRSPQISSSPGDGGTAAIRRWVPDATDDEIGQLQNDPRIRKAQNPGGYVTTLGKSGDLRRLLQELRHGRKQADLKQRREELDTMSPCEHGTPGGNVPHPETGLPWKCALCRAASGNGRAPGSGRAGDHGNQEGGSS